MCGIFGFVESGKSQYSKQLLASSFVNLGKLSVRRGKDSSGICMPANQNLVRIVKGPITIKELLKSQQSKSLIEAALHRQESVRFGFGHSRLVTNGTQLDESNNQPIIRDNLICIHNGIVTNVEELWEEYRALGRRFEIDTEVLVAIVRKTSMKVCRLLLL